MHPEILLADVAHARAGDKGNTLNVAVFVFEPAHYAWLARNLTEAVVAERFAHRRPQQVTRHCLPNLHGMNFVIDGALEGGVNQSATLDRHGKSLSYLLLGLRLPSPAT
ncbi:hypothetical protein EVC62_03860 [Salinicola endophyticus]|uniref:AtuA-like ferredoxin-fold domain-containing protein n=1 Tax=Salinicola endophyticus TaxID=1949083 RepID=A0ABY8FGH5_9GAMM|nr:hypothetical protein [Salinicola endophyticus]WFF40703.1 hypothetical protein EVC62_03860 [Salinicola endophyticus]